MKNKAIASPAPSARRIRRPDPLNWTVEEYSAADREITHGKYAGQRTKGRWRVRSYHATLSSAAKECLDQEIGDGWDAADERGHAKEIIAAIGAAVARVEEIVHEAVGAQPDMAVAESG